ncbi:MAG TPA: alpha-ribazole phosphatase, partial [Lentisphaeria bacterium]|nr:alpha-ribazole phosphatase [Lentisphaeria bacterium]
MQTTEIILLRHGETIANANGTVQGQLDVELNATGVRQAERLAERLRDVRLDAIYASDLSRAMHTARIVAEPHKLDVIPSPEFREWHLGAWQGRRIADILTLFPGEFEGFVHDSLTAVI